MQQAGVFAVVELHRDNLPRRVGREHDFCAVALCADSGLGKSTLAAGLCARGITLFSDDVLWVDAQNRPPETQSVNRRLKLDTLAARLAKVTLREPVRSVFGEQADARHYADPEAVTPSRADKLPLSRIYVLTERDRRPGAPYFEIEPLKGVEALAAVRRNVFRRAWGEALAGAGAINRAAATIAGSVEVYRFARTSVPQRFADTVEAIAAHLQERTR